MVFAPLDARHFSSPLYATGAFQAVIPVLELGGSELSPCVSSWRRTAWDSRSFSHRHNPHWFLQPEIMGTFLLGTGTLGCGAWCGAGTPYPQDIPPEFLSTTRGCGTIPFDICAPPTILYGCGFFNSVVVRLPFNSISDGSEWWLFYILVVILMWLCEDVSHVCLCYHLDWRFTFRSSCDSVVHCSSIAFFTLV